MATDGFAGELLFKKGRDVKIDADPRAIGTDFQERVRDLFFEDVFAKGIEA